MLCMLILSKSGGTSQFKIDSEQQIFKNLFYGNFFLLTLWSYGQKSANPTIPETSKINESANIAGWTSVTIRE